MDDEWQEGDDDDESDDDDDGLGFLRADNVARRILQAITDYL